MICLKTRVCEDEIYVYIHIRVYVHARVSAKLLQSCLTLCDPRYCSPPGSSQARILECVALPPPDPRIASASPGVPTLQADSLPLSHCRINLRGSPDLGVHGFSYWEKYDADLELGRDNIMST